MKRLIMVLLIVLSAVLVIGCAKVETGLNNSTANPDNAASSENIVAASESNVVNIIIKNFEFTPVSVTITSGTTIKWINQDSTAHSIKSDKVNSDTLGKGQSFEYTFTDAGTYDYICGLHPSMKARIIVE